MSIKEPESAENPKPKKKRLKKVVIGLAVLATLLSGSAYLAQDWLIDEMRTLVINKLNEVGIYVDYTSARQDPVRGAVVEKVLLYETEKKEKPILTITNLGLSPSLRQWFLDGELSIKITLKDSEVSMLVNGEEVERLEKVTSVMKAGASGITVKHLSTVMNGVSFDLRGLVDFGSSKNKLEVKEEIETIIEDKEKLLLDFSFLEPLGEWLSVQTKQGKLHVVSDFNINASDMDGMIVNSRFTGDSFVWHGVAFDHINADVTYSGKNRSIEVKSFEAAYHGKSAKGELRYLMSAKTLEITKLDSQVDFMSWIQDYSGKGSEDNEEGLVLIQAPHLGLSGRLDFSDLKKSDLEVAFLNAADAAVKSGGRSVSMKELKGKLMFAGGNVSVPEPGISAKLEGGGIHISGEMAVMGGRQSRSANLNVSGKSVHWHGLTFDHMNADVTYSGKDSVVGVKSLDLAYEGKKVTGDFRYVIPTKMLKIDGLESQVDFLKLARDYSGKNNEGSGQKVDMIQAPVLGLSGYVDFGDIEKSELKVEFLDSDKVVVKVGERQIEMKELKGGMAFSGGKVKTLDTGLSAEIDGGKFQLHGEGSLPTRGAQNNNGISANFTVEGKSFTLHGVSIDQLKSDVIYSGGDQSLDVKSLDLSYRGKSVRGAGRYLVKSKILDIIQLDSELDLLALSNDFSGKNTEKSDQELVMLQPPRLGLSGRLDIKDIQKSDFKVEFLKADKVAVKVGERHIEMKELKGTMAFSEGKVRTLDPGLSAQFAEGEVYLAGEMEILGDMKPYQMSFKMNNVLVDELNNLIRAGGENGASSPASETSPASASETAPAPASETSPASASETASASASETSPATTSETASAPDSETAPAPAQKKSVMKLFSKASEKAAIKDSEKISIKDSEKENTMNEVQELPGRLFFKFDGSGDKAIPVKNAHGDIKIEGAKFYSMRTLSSLFAAMDKVVPSFWKKGERTGAQTLTGTYLVQDEKIRSDDLTLNGDLGQILVKGDYDLQEKIVNLDGKAQFTGAVGIATGLASNLLEISGTGPLNDIAWKFKNLNAMGVVKAGTKGVADTSKQALKLGGDTAKGTAEITGKGVKMIGEGLIKVLPLKKKKQQDPVEE